MTSTLTLLILATAFLTGIQNAYALDNGVAKLPVLGYNSKLFSCLHCKKRGSILIGSSSMECVSGESLTRAMNDLRLSNVIYSVT